jgi:hypothetical protein
MTIDLLYSLLKIISMLATGAFGALGLLTNYKDDQGKITKWGKVAIGGILISSGISLVLYALETSRAKKEAEATKQKLEIILANATATATQQERSLYETEKLKLGLEKSLQRSDEIAKGMDKSLAAQKSVLNGNEKIFSGVTVAVRKQTDILGLTTTSLQDVERLLHPLHAAFTAFYSVRLDAPEDRGYIDSLERWRQKDTSGEPPFPTKADKRAAALLDASLETTLFFYRGPEDTSRREPDLIVEITDKKRKRGSPPVGLELFLVEYPKDRLQRRVRESVHFSGESCSPPIMCFDEPTIELNLVSKLYSKKTIEQEQDLLGALMEVRFCPDPPTSSWDTTEQRQALEALFDLRVLVIEFDPGETMEIYVGGQGDKHNGGLVEVARAPGSTDECKTYRYRFPDSMEKLHAAFKR